jgi:hypothetical protein
VEPRSGRVAGHEGMERGARAHSGSRRVTRGEENVLYRPLPLAPGPERVQRCERAVRRHGRTGSQLRQEDPVCELLRVGHLPGRNPAPVHDRPRSGLRHDAVLGRRRCADRFSAHLAARQLGYPNHERGLSGSGHLRRIRIRGAGIQRQCRSRSHDRRGE